MRRRRTSLAASMQRRTVKRAMRRAPISASADADLARCQKVCEEIGRNYNKWSQAVKSVMKDIEQSGQQSRGFGELPALLKKLDTVADEIAGELEMYL